MRGHVRKRGKASWAIVIDIGYDEKGKRRQKWHTVRGTKRDAERELARIVNELNVGIYVEPSHLSVKDYLKAWLQDHARFNVSGKTFERYQEIIEQNFMPDLGHFSLANLRPLHIQALYSKALEKGRKDGQGGLSAQTVLHFHRILHNALSQAVKWQLLARNPADAVEPPRAQRKEMRALTEAETLELIKLVDGRPLYIPVILAVSTGMRRGEILALRWNDVDLLNGTAIVCQSLEQTPGELRFKTPKTSKGLRTLALPAFAVELLQEHRASQLRQKLSLGPAYKDHKLICPRPDGRPWPPDVFSTAFAALVRKSSFQHFRFHDLRHTHATQLLLQGVHPKVVSERLGHSAIGITLDTYSHVLPGMQQEAAQKINASLQQAIRNRRT